MSPIFHLQRSTRQKKKFMVISSEGTKVHFGHSDYDDFTAHKNESRKKSYISRHQNRENWHKGGMYTAGFWSRWLLWNKPTIEKSVKDIFARFDIQVIDMR